MKLHTAGIGPILVQLAGVSALLIFLNWIFPAQSPVHYFLYVTAFVFMFLVVRFFRFPDREALPDEDAVYSGADGRVVAIEKVYEKEYFNSERIQVSVFMSAMNVHINWSPVGGEVVYKKHHPGKHVVAFNPKSSLINEHTTLVFRDEKGREVMMRQIAGAVARRIICKPEPGNTVSQGEMIGMIKFGSRVDLLLPVDAKIHVEIGDLPRGCETLMARLN